MLTGEEAENLDSPVDLTIHTKCPEKWLLVDLETGQEYRGQVIPNKYGKWKRVKE